MQQLTGAVFDFADFLSENASKQYSRSHFYFSEVVSVDEEYDFDEKEWLEYPEECIQDDLKMQSQFRKMRFFGCACVRRVWHLLEDERAQKAVEVAERFADGFLGEKELNEAHRLASEAVFDDDEETGNEVDATIYTTVELLCEIDAVRWHPGDLASDNVRSLLVADPESESKAQALLLHDIFGNPFRPVTFRTDWLTPTITRLAQSAYEDRRFDLLPILADALEEAGCDNTDILDHCRTFPVHVRGCWVVDQILGKS